MNYEEFLEKKRISISESGFELKDSDLNPKLKDFQKYIIKEGIKKGRYAVFAGCGLGKTFMQLEWAYHVSNHTKMPVLIVAPLAVVDQTKLEAEKFNIDMKYIDVTNYEQLDHFDAEDYSGVVLDESSILKNFTGKMRTELIEKFQHTPYKLCCTATPSPNDIDELGNHAEFLNIMGHSEMRSMFFVNDMQTTQKWRLKKHAEIPFWKWVSSWALMLNNPGDLGFNSTGYNLKPLNMIKIDVETAKKDNGMLFDDTAVSATEYNQELRRSVIGRVYEASKIVNSSADSFIVWVKQNEEADRLKELIPEAIEVRGNERPEVKSKKLLDFGRGKYRVLITKTSIAQYGLNFQNCHNMIFLSLDFSFESTYQAIRRSWRFGQINEVNVYLIAVKTMYNVVETFKRKEKQFENMQKMMIEFFKKGENATMETMDNKECIKTDHFEIYRGDCVEELKNIPDDSIGLSIFSPPFAELYTYSNYEQDMGNSEDSEQFYEHFKFLVKELKRVIKPGREVCVHCMDLPTRKSVDGFIGLKDFSGDLVKLFQENGFIYHTRITIWKDPVVQMQRTKALGLLHKQIKKDSSMSRVGLPDYILVFRDNRENIEPITHSVDDLPVDLWQKYASPVWYDINNSNTLQKNDAKDEKDEKHICPLQLDTIERCIHLWSNKGDRVLTPFMGIGSEVYQAIKMDRIGVGVELKKSYFDVAKSNCDNAVSGKNQLSLF